MNRGDNWGKIESRRWKDGRREEVRKGGRRESRAKNK